MAAVDLTQKLTLAMSGGALLVSCLVAWQTYRSRHLTEAINRAVVTVESARLTSLKRGGGEILLTLENSGKAMAQDIKVKYFVAVVTEITPEHPNAPPPTIPDDPEEFGNIAPSKHSTRALMYELPTDRDLPEWANLVVISIRLRYTDEATDSQFNEHVSYSGLLSGRKIITPEMMPGPIPTLEALGEPFQRPKFVTSKHVFFSTKSAAGVSCC
jgi:hypothetical protein